MLMMMIMTMMMIMKMMTSVDSLPGKEQLELASVTFRLPTPLHACR